MADIFWIEGDPPASLAIVPCPPGLTKLSDRLAEIRQGRVETVVSLLEEQEAEWLGLSEERTLAEQAGMRFLSYPMHDAMVPQNPTSFREFVSGLADRLSAGERIAVHCRGSIGRSTVVAACTLIHLGWDPADALDAIEEARGVPVPDTIEQEDWILDYQAEP
jgi:protein-tyrosine phosphatase